MAHLPEASGMTYWCQPGFSVRLMGCDMQSPATSWSVSSGTRPPSARLTSVQWSPTLTALLTQRDGLASLFATKVSRGFFTSSSSRPRSKASRDGVVSHTKSAVMNMGSAGIAWCTSAKRASTPLKGIPAETSCRTRRAGSPPPPPPPPRNDSSYAKPAPVLLSRRGRPTCSLLSGRPTRSLLSGASAAVGDDGAATPPNSGIGMVLTAHSVGPGPKLAIDKEGALLAWIASLAWCVCVWGGGGFLRRFNPQTLVF
mmetsp:Transcript_39808/g.124394  ORF Transcript_39808/g.124394 Transcript_39808/m.124394 type:complete len:256 (+) Transcript_39808:1342-2109(+)